MRKQCGSSDASGLTSSTFDFSGFCDPKCPIPEPIHWRGYTYATNGAVVVRVPGKFAEDGEHHALSASLHLWNHEWLSGWTSQPPKSVENRWFEESVIDPVRNLPGVQFCDPDGGRSPARFRFRDGQGLVWPAIRRTKDEES